MSDTNVLLVFRKMPGSLENFCSAMATCFLVIWMSIFPIVGVLVSLGLYGS